jgi:hypothetical protein
MYTNALGVDVMFYVTSAGTPVVYIDGAPTGISAGAASFLLPVGSTIKLTYTGGNIPSVAVFGN